MISIISIANGKIENISYGVMEMLSAFTEKTIVLQSDKIELANHLKNNDIPFVTLDEIYENAQDFNELNEQSKLFLENLPHPLLCVLGEIYLSKLVCALVEDGVEIHIPACAGDIPRAILSSGGFPKNGVSIISATDITPMFDMQTTLVVTELSSPFLASEVKLQLSSLYGDEQTVYLFDGVDSRKLMLYEIDGQETYSHLTTLVIPPTPLLLKKRYTYSDVLNIMGILRSENGCPWDREQTHQSIKTCMIEECNEAVEALESQDMEHFCDELGDVLLQVALHGQIGLDCGEFDHLDITTALCQKLIRRHPHVFGDVKIDTVGELKTLWDEIKKTEKL